MCLWVIGVVCVRGVGNVDHLLLCCEIASVLWSVIFSCVKLAWVLPRRIGLFCLLGEVWEAVFRVQLYGRWFCLAFCGVFGEKEMVEILKIVRGWWWN